MRLLANGPLVLPGLVESLGEDPGSVRYRFGYRLANGPAQLNTIGTHTVHACTSQYIVYDALGIS